MTITSSTLTAVRGYLEYVAPDSTMESAVFSETTSLDVLAFCPDSEGMTLFVADDVAGGELNYLQISAGIATDVTDLDAALSWTNSSTRSVAVGKFYCAQDKKTGAVSVVWELGIDAQHLGGLDRPNNAQPWRWLGEGVKGARLAMTSHAEYVCSETGARPFYVTEDDARVLVRSIG